MALPNWLNISASSGSGDTVISVSAESSMELSNRLYDLTLSGNTKSVTIRVDQAKGRDPFLDVWPTSLTYSYEPGTREISVYTNGSWNVTKQSYFTGATISPTSGTSASTGFTISMPANTKMTPVSGYCTVSLNEAELSTRINITQDGNNPLVDNVLTFDIVSAGTVSWISHNYNEVNIYYKKNDDAEWTKIRSGDNTSINVDVSDKLYFVGDNYHTAYATSSSLRWASFGGTAKYNVSGNIMSILKSSGFETKKDIDSYALACLFGDAGIIDASNLVLPATSLTGYCYYKMFTGCTSMTAAPQVLPAKTLAECCYHSMFYNCTSLTSAPEICATTLAANCCNSMFRGCTSLTTAPVLWAPEPTNIIRGEAYTSMFSGCTSLNYIKCMLGHSGGTPNWVANVAPTGTFVKSPLASDWPINSVNGIPSGWTVVEDYTFNGALEFDVVSAGTIDWGKSYTGYTTNYIYYQLNNDPWVRVSATTVTYTSATSADTIINANAGDTVKFVGFNDSYASGNTTYGMFRGTAKYNLKGNIMSVIDGYNYKTLKDLTGTYNLAGFFAGTGVIDASELSLPATGLTRACYRSMFSSCGSLIKAPELPATRMDQYCYESMFGGCTQLTAAPELPAETIWGQCYLKMFNGCSSLNYIKCLARNPNTSTTGNWVYGVATNGTFTKWPTANWSIGNSGIPTTWVTAGDPSQHLTFVVNGAGNICWKTTSESFSKTIYYRKNNGQWTSLTPTTGGTTFSVVSGDVIELKGDNSTYSDGSDFCTFSGTTARFSVIGNILSLVNSELYQYLYTLTQDYTFYGLFDSCTGLTTAGGLILQATSLTEGCYSVMFHNCTSLTAPPALPSTSLATECYTGMFMDCTSLTEAPALPATTLTNFCYSYMFRDCTSLVSAPELPAPTLVTGCYSGMFYGCSTLNHIKCLARNPGDSYCTSWVYGVAATGIFEKYPTVTSWTVGNNGIPTGWVAQNMPALYLSTHQMSFSYRGWTNTGSTAFAITADTNWTATTVSQGDWPAHAIDFKKSNSSTWTATTITGTSGVSYYNLRAGSNRGLSDRYWTIEFTTGEYSDTMDLSQNCYTTTPASITYTSSDGNIINPREGSILGGLPPYQGQPDPFELTMVSNVYENGVGTMTFNAPVINYIGASAFTNSDRLTSINIPDYVLYIGDHYATTVDGQGNPLYTNVLSGYTFYNCTALSSVTFGTGLEIIGPYSFAGCTALSGITWPNNAKLSLRYNAFAGCTSLTTLNIPTNICLGAVRLNTGANRVIEDGVAYSVFSGCSGLTTLNISAGGLGDSRGIPVAAFYGCKNLTNVVIPYGYTRVRSDSFARCESLTSITFSNTVNSIGLDGDFWNRKTYNSIATGPKDYRPDGTPLEVINCYATVAPTIVSSGGGSGGLSFINEGGVLHYPAGSDYSSWLTPNGDLPYNLGDSNWTGVADL